MSLTPHYLPPIEFFLSSVSLASVPFRFSKAFVDPKWGSAMEKESKPSQECNMGSCDLPKDKELVGLKWVYTIKHN